MGDAARHYKRIPPFVDNPLDYDPIFRYLFSDHAPKCADYQMPDE